MEKLLVSHVCHTSLLTTLWEKEKLLTMSNFSFSHSVFKRLVLLTRKSQGLFGKGLNRIRVNMSLTGDTEQENSGLRTCAVSTLSDFLVTVVLSLDGSLYSNWGICPAFTSVPLLDFLDPLNLNTTLVK